MCVILIKQWKKLTVFILCKMLFPQPHMAPEVYRRLPFDGHAIDVWAAGTVLLFMLTGRRLSNPPLIDRVFDGVELGLSYEATDLLRRMFRLDPNDRLTLQQIQQHPFVASYFFSEGHQILPKWQLS